MKYITPARLVPIALAGLLMTACGSESTTTSNAPAPIEAEIPAEKVAVAPGDESAPADDTVSAYCVDHVYFSAKDANCTRANYQNPPHADRLLAQMEVLYGKASKARAVNDCLEQGGLPYYNPDAPGGSQTGCTANGAAPTTSHWG